jgi:hypothetical protein
MLNFLYLPKIRYFANIFHVNLTQHLTWTAENEKPAKKFFSRNSYANIDKYLYFFIFTF